MAITEFSAALNQVAAERGISVQSVLDSIRLALASAYKKDYGGSLESIVVNLDPDTGEASIFIEDKDVTPSGFGRIAAQTAKQVILQKIRETEKGVIMDEYKAKIGSIVSGQVFRAEGGLVVLDLGKAHGILPQQEQVPTEVYRVNQRMKVLVKEVREGQRNPEIIVSRSDPDFIKKLFEQEVPEIASGVVVIQAIAREAGSRTKMAVYSKDEKVDPVGSCVGQKGVRVQSIISEIFGEKIDIIPWSATVEKFVAASLSPAKVTDVELDQENKKATVSVPEDQQSLAIGKEGQNARLANKLTKWKIDIKGTVGLFGVADEAKPFVDRSTTTKGIWDEAIKESEEKSRKEVQKKSDEKVGSDAEIMEPATQTEATSQNEPEQVQEAVDQPSDKPEKKSSKKKSKKSE